MRIHAHEVCHDVLCVVAPSGTGEMVLKEVCWAKYRAAIWLYGGYWWASVGGIEQNPTTKGAYSPLKHKKVGKTDYE